MHVGMSCLQRLLLREMEIAMMLLMIGLFHIHSIVHLNAYMLKRLRLAVLVLADACSVTVVDDCDDVPQAGTVSGQTQAPA